MTRLEFSNQLSELRQSSGIKMKDICFAMNVMPTEIYRLENGKNSFNMAKAISYLHSINGYIQLRKNKTIYSIMQYEDIVQWLINERKDNYTQRALTQKTGCANGTIGNIESGKSIMSIDFFLRLAEVLEFSITIAEK